MAAVADELKILLRAETKAAVSALRKAQQQTNKTELSFGKLAGAIGVGNIAARAFTKALGVVRRGFMESIQAASDFQEVSAKFDTVFKDQSDSVREWAETFADSVGRASSDQLKFLATIQDTLVPLGFARGAAADMSKQVVQLATDLGSFNNLPTDQVIRDIQSALVGNTETLRKYGVVANQAAIEQEALTSGIWDGEGALTAQEKAAAIMKLTLDGTVDAQGDAIRTADSFANTQRRLQAELTELKISLGETTTEGLKPFISALTDSISEMNDARDAAKELADAYEAVAGGEASADDRLIVLRRQRDETQRLLDMTDAMLARTGQDRGELEAQLTALNAQISAMQQRANIEAQLNRQVQERTQAEQAAAEEQRRQLEEEEQRRQSIAETIAKIEQQYQEDIRRTNELRQIGFLTASDQLEGMARAAEKYVEAMVDAGLAGQGGADFADRVQLVRAYAEAQQSAARDVGMAFGKAGQAATKAGKEAVDAAKEVENAWGRAAQSIYTAMSNTYSSWMSLEQNRSDLMINNLQRELEAMQEQNEQSLEYKEALGYSEEELQAVREELAAQEAERQKEIDREKGKAAKKQFERQKLIDIANATQAGAVAVVRALELGPIAGPIAAAVVGSMAAAQIGMIQATKFPGFARGGDFVTSGPQLIMVGDNPGGRERVRIDPQPDNRSMGGVTISVSGNAFYGTAGEDEFIEKLTRRQQQLTAQGVLT